MAFLSGREADVSGVHTSNPSLLVWSLLRVFSSLAQFVSVLVEATVWYRGAPTAHTLLQSLLQEVTTPRVLEER